MFGSQVPANSRGNYIRQLSLEIVCSSLHDSGGTSQICCTELLTPPVRLSQRKQRGLCRRCQDVRSVGGDAVAIFNTGASKSPKAQRGGPRFGAANHQVSSLGDLRSLRLCKVTGRWLGGAAEAPFTDPGFQQTFALTLFYIKPTKIADRLCLISHIQPKLLLH